MYFTLIYIFILQHVYFENPNLTYLVLVPRTATPLYAFSRCISHLLPATEDKIKCLVNAFNYLPNDNAARSVLKSLSEHHKKCESKLSSFSAKPKIIDTFPNPSKNNNNNKNDIDRSKCSSNKRSCCNDNNCCSKSSKSCSLNRKTIKTIRNSTIKQYSKKMKTVLDATGALIGYI